MSYYQKYVKEVIEICNESIARHEKEKHSHGKNDCSYECFYRAYLNCVLDLILTDEICKNLLWASEQKYATELKSSIINHKISFVGIIKHLRLILQDTSRGFWIFDIGLTNGFLYEVLIGVAKFLKDSALIKSAQINNRMGQKMNFQSTSRHHAAVLFQKTIQSKNRLHAGSDDDISSSDREFIEQNQPAKLRT